jgi:uncharacterized protein (DUF2141 family)
MRHIRFSLAALVLAIASSAAAEPVVSVTITGVAAPRGYMMVALHNADTWSGGAPAARARVAVSGGAVTLSLVAPTPGRYGIKVFHDVDSDGTMAANLIGIPTEPIGFSNDAPIRLGPPNFADAAFDVGPSGAAQTITLK